MVNGIAGALNAYNQALMRIGGEVKTPAVEETKNAQAQFGDMVKSALEETVDLQKESENLTIKNIQGKADIQDVVLAVSNAEAALETVVAVRDTAIKAYNTIMQMNI